jgi:hypothetical protein
VHIHKPRAAHSLREFLSEIGVIVVGVLIALTAEQMAEQLHWRERTREVRGQLISETSSNATSALEWLALSPCLDQQLAAADKQIWDARRSGALQPAEPRFSPTLVEFTSDAWLNARSLQVADHLSADEVSTFTRAYFFASELTGDVTRLHELGAELEPLTRSLDHVSPAEADEFIAKLGRIKELQSRMELAAVLLIRDADKVHAQIPLGHMPAEAAVQRKFYGSCVIDPAEMLRWARSMRFDDQDAYRRMRLAKPDLPG